MVLGDVMCRPVKLGLPVVLQLQTMIPEEARDLTKWVNYKP